MASGGRFGHMPPELSLLYLHHLHTIMGKLLLDDVGINHIFEHMLDLFYTFLFSADFCRDRLPENCLKLYDGEDLLIQPEVNNSYILGASYAIYSLNGKGASM